LVHELATEGALGLAYATRYAELAAWMCTQRPLDETWASLKSDTAQALETTWAVLGWLARSHRAAVEPELVAVLAELAELDGPRSIPWWLDASAGRDVGVLPRHSEAELFDLARRDVEARIEGLVHVPRALPASGLTVAAPGE
jgi:hypothetical protein